MENTYNGGPIRLTYLSFHTILQNGIHSLLKTLADNIK